MYYFIPLYLFFMLIFMLYHYKCLWNGRGCAFLQSLLDASTRRSQCTHHLSACMCNSISLCYVNNVSTIWVQGQHFRCTFEHGVTKKSKWKSIKCFQFFTGVGGISLFINLILYELVEERKLRFVSFGRNMVDCFSFCCSPEWPVQLDITMAVSSKI